MKVCTKRFYVGLLNSLGEKSQPVIISKYENFLSN